MSPKQPLTAQERKVLADIKGMEIRAFGSLILWMPAIYVLRETLGVNPLLSGLIGLGVVAFFGFKAMTARCPRCNNAFNSRDYRKFQNAIDDDHTYYGPLGTCQNCGLKR